MKKFLPLSLTVLLVSLAVGGCADPHNFPCLRPLFPGLSEYEVPAKAQTALARAKTDLEIARHGQPPHYARYVGEESTSRSRIYEGDGYELKMSARTDPTQTGPMIALGPSITGGKPWLYDEVDTTCF